MFKLFRRFASLPDDSPRGNALILFKRREYAAADAAFTALLSDGAMTTADRAWCVNKRGVTRVHLQRRDEALADFRAALELVPRFPPALSNIGNLLLEDGRVEEAVAQFEEAIAADPEYPVAYVNLGAALKRLGRFEESVRALRTAQRLEGRLRKKPRMHL